MKNPFKKKEEPKPEPEQPTKVMESDFIMNEEKTESKQEKAEAKVEAAEQQPEKEAEFKLGLHLGAFEQQLYGIIQYQIQQNQVILEELNEIKAAIKEAK